MYTIYTKPNCHYCNNAKELLNRKNISFVEHVIDSPEAKQMLLEIVPNARSVPQIFHGAEYVGGYNELFERIMSNEQRTFLAE